MDLKDTIEDMLSEDYKRRYKAEYKQVAIRITKLIDYIKHYKACDNNVEIELKAQQLQAMIQYKNILAKGAKKWTRKRKC